MSASEKLKELVDSHGWPPLGLKEALPEIIAVVEALEAGHGEEYIDVDPDCYKCKALLALDAKLPK